MSVCVRACLRVRACVYVCACMRVSVCARVRACVRACVCVSTLNRNDAGGRTTGCLQSPSIHCQNSYSP